MLLITESSKVRGFYCGALLALGAAGLTGGTAPASPATPAPPASPVGGPQLGSPGLVVNYPTAKVPRLPNVTASSFVIADAGSGQVLAAKDAHGRFLPASTLKVLTAVALLPVLNPHATVVASRRATST